MRSIKYKLIISKSAMIMVAILIIAVPTLTNQHAVLKKTLLENASMQISSAVDSVNAFLDKPKTIVKDISFYVTRAKLNLEQTQQDFDNLIKATPSLSCLYYADEVPMSKGGMVYSSDGWIPDNDYDKEVRDWFAGAKNSDDAILTEPYVDPDTKSLITTVACAARNDGQFYGVVSIDILLTELNAMVQNKKLTENGKTFIIDKNGLYLTNEEFDKIMKTNFFDEYKSLAKYKSNFGSDVFINIKAAGGYYIAGRVINKDLGWILVTVGRSAEIYLHVKQNITIVIALALLSLIFSVLLAVIITSHIVRPIKSVDVAVNKIAKGDADLTHRLKATTHDEVGNLVIGFNKFIDKLHRIVSDVKGSKNSLADVENELQQSIETTASSITEILANIESIAGQVDQQSNSVLQTSAAVTEIAENINSLEQMIENQANGVAQASAAVEQMIGNISSVNTSVEQMAESFSALEQNTNEGIEKQLGVTDYIVEIQQQSKALQDANAAIDNVANKTNLLAMNAAIEAAHAGDAGKGFAVVADEIRKLSETSSSESKKISEELRKITATIEAVVIAARESSESFAGVTEKIAMTDELITVIKSAMEEQQIGSQQIAESLRVMNDSTTEVRTASHEMAIGNKQILNEVQNLQDATSEIKNGMNEMSIGAKDMNNTSAVLSGISSKVRDSVRQIGEQIDQFKV